MASQVIAIVLALAIYESLKWAYELVRDLDRWHK